MEATAGTAPRDKHSEAGKPSDGTSDDSSQDSSDDRGLRGVWHDMAEPRRAACLAWVAFVITWLITRFITVHGKDSGKGAALSIAGHHVHHYLFGIILLGLVSAAAIFWKPRRGWQFFGLGYGIALALILDEYALLLNLSDVYWKEQGTLSVDIVLTFIGVGGAYITGMTWIHEALRRTKRGRARRGRASS